MAVTVWLLLAAFGAGFVLGYLVKLWLTPSRQDYSRMPRGDERVK
jgi:hypothetical protein